MLCRKKLALIVEAFIKLQSPAFELFLDNRRTNKPHIMQ